MPLPWTVIHSVGLCQDAIAVDRNPLGWSLHSMPLPWTVIHSVGLCQDAIAVGQTPSRLDLHRCQSQKVGLFITIAIAVGRGPLGWTLGQGIASGIAGSQSELMRSQYLRGERENKREKREKEKKKEKNY